MYELRNKIILIPGGLGLIGKEISKNLASEGAKVIVLDLKKNKLKKKSFFYSKNEKNPEPAISNRRRRIILWRYNSGSTYRTELVFAPIDSPRYQL